jgi:hypothetical protein
VRGGFEGVYPNCGPTGPKRGRSDEALSAWNGRAHQNRFSGSGLAKVSNAPMPFMVTVFVHGEGGMHDLVPKDSGEVVMELGGKVQRQQIGPNGTVDFKDIPPSHRGEAASLWFESDQFESVQPDQRYVLKGDDIQMEVRRKAGEPSGRVQDENGNPVEVQRLNWPLSTTTDSAGRFELPIPGNLLRPQRRDGSV